MSTGDVTIDGLLATTNMNVELEEETHGSQIGLR
jgi:hypothetical protein